MQHFRYELTLESAVLLPSPAGRRTEGGGPGLDFIPGATLLGALARDYSTFTDPWAVFHSGQVQFGDARVMVEDTSTRAQPMAWHQRKGERPVLGVCDPRWRNRALPESGDEPTERWTMARGGHLAPDGRLASLESDLALKTAVAFDTQRASDGQLFHEPVLKAGQRFAGTIRFAETVPAATRDAVLASLCEREIVHLGRRRRAGRGRARLTVQSQATPPNEAWPTAAAPVGGRVYLWLLSEVALFDPVADQPTLTPDPQGHLGCPPGVKVDWHRSFLRPARWTPYNGHRQRPDVERRVLKAGGVLCLTGVDAAALAQLQHACADGVGAYRAEGLGRIHVHPKLLTLSVAEAFDPPHSPSPKRIEPTGLPPQLTAMVADKSQTSRLAGWLHARALEALRQRAAYQLVDDAFANRFAASKASTGPTPSQWTQVAGTARALRSRPNAAARLKTALFGEQRALCRSGVGSRTWFPSGRRGPGQELEEFCIDLISRTDADGVAPLAVGLLADRLAKHQQREH